MNKTRVILAASGGAIALAVLVMAFFAWCAFSDKTAAFQGDEENDGLETVVGQISSLTSKKPFPSPANAKQIEANRSAVEAWYAAVRQDAARGDWAPVGADTPAQFKELVGQDAKRLMATTNATGEAIIKPDFGFGPFKEYLGDKMPAKSELPRLQRQWHDLMSLTELLVGRGIVRLSDFQVVGQKPESASEPKAKKRGAKPAGADESSDKPSVETYKFAFACRPAAFVGIVRDLSFQERFTVVENFTFAHERDAIAEHLGGDEKKDAAASAGGRRARRRAAAAAEPKEEKARSSTAFDPAADSTLNVELTVSVHDFRSLEDDGKKEESK